MYISPWALILGGIAIAYLIHRRFRKIERFIRKSELSEQPSDALSYQASIHIRPDWIKLIRWCFPNLKTDAEAKEFVKNLYDDTELKLDKELSLFEKDFSFVEFYDGVSGFNPIWSPDEKRFLDKLEVSGPVFHGKEGHTKSIADMFPDNRIARDFVVSPDFIGFRSNLPDGDMGDEDKAGRFPYGSVIQFFAELEPGHGANSMVKKFSPQMQALFDRFQTKYDPWDYEGHDTGVEASKQVEESTLWLEHAEIELYKQKMRSQTFNTPYFTVTIALKFFTAHDRCGYTGL